MPERAAPAPKPQQKIAEVIRDRAPEPRYYKDTPAKRAVRELRQHWAPIFSSQETPPFREMTEAAHRYDTTKFTDTERYYAMPPIAPTGYGAHHPDENRETSHFMGQFLENINPELAVLYRGGAHNEHQDRVQNNIHMDYLEKDHLGRAQRRTRKLKAMSSYSEPESSRSTPNYIGRPMEIFSR